MVANILLVEDEEALAQFLKQELTYEGYNVSVEFDGILSLIHI